MPARPGGATPGVVDYTSAVPTGGGGASADFLERLSLAEKMPASTRRGRQPARRAVARDFVRPQEAVVHAADLGAHVRHHRAEPRVRQVEQLRVLLRHRANEVVPPLQADRLGDVVQDPSHLPSANRLLQQKPHFIRWYADQVTYYSLVVNEYVGCSRNPVDALERERYRG